jgi:hypothetical protein
MLRGGKNAFAADADARKPQRDAAGARIHWTFTTERARDKLIRVYFNAF